MKKTVVAVIGCGSIANRSHIPAYVKNENVEIKWFCDNIPERADAAVEQYGCGKAVYDYREILNDPEVDAVSVCVPNFGHAPISIDFMRAGKDVLCEKPAARTYEEAKTMLDVQEETGRILNIGVVNRYSSIVNEIKKLISEGALGEIYHVYVSYRSQRSIPGLGGPFTTKELAGGGVLIDWGVHFLDAVMYCCGEPKPLTATAETFCKLGKNIGEYAYVDMWAGPPVMDGTYDVEEAITGMIRTEGPTISMNGAWAQNIAEDEMYVDFVGDKGGIRWDYLGGFKMYGTKDGMLTETHFKYQSSNAFETEINAFVECLQTREEQRNHIKTNINTSKLMQALYDSAELHKEIVIE